jgi:MFS transporter, DHA2 family, multidrug resistance protein
LPFLMIDLWHFDAGTTGLVLSAWPLGAIVGAPLSGPAMKRWHSSVVASCGLVLLGAGMVCIALVADGASAPNAAWRLALTGFGFGLFLSPNVHLIVSSAPVRRAGAAGGMLGTARLAGQAAGASILAAICNKTVFNRPGWALALWLAVVFIAGATALSMVRVRRVA